MKNINDTELVSIIMPTYNSEDFVHESIESVIAQSYNSWELIVVDDCSTDGTVPLLNAFRNRDDRIIISVLGTNQGSAVARNSAIQLARGRFIAFLDSDDVWLPDKLEIQISIMKSDGIPFTYTAYERIDESGEHQGFVHVPPRVNYNELLKSNVIACLTVIYDTHYFGKLSMPDIRKGQDYALWLKMLKAVDSAVGVQTILAKYRVRKNSISSNKLESSTWVWKIFRESEGMGIIKSFYYFAHYIFYGVKRRLLVRAKNRVTQQGRAL